MKIGRNDLCPCGSGKKYKFCCINKNNLYSLKENVKKIACEIENGNILGDIFLDFLSIIKREQWIGACHAISSAMYVVLSEAGFSSKLCVGEVGKDGLEFAFDHSWIEINEKVIDCAIGFPLKNVKISNPIFLNIDIANMKDTDVNYGIYRNGLDFEANFACNTEFTQYMDMMPKFKNGLWSVVEEVCINNNIPFDLSEFRKKYKDTERLYVRH